VSDTRVSLLTAPGTGAIATIEVSGPRAWEFARKLFRPVGKPLPQLLELHRFWYGRIGDGVGDEVILAVTSATPQPAVEVHCHGGQRVVRWVIEQFVTLGCGEAKPTDCHLQACGKPRVFELLQRAPTLRTASILLDQLHGAFEKAVQRILSSSTVSELHQLARYASVGRHLVEPWKVIIAGPPNVGKSSLVNKLAGYQRAVVSEFAGTTRDILTVRLALEGWPVELTDTAGLRAAEGLEAEGIDRAKRVLNEADLVVWLHDASEISGTDTRGVAVTSSPNSPNWLEVWNKSDLTSEPLPGLSISAKSGAGIPELVTAIVRRLVPDPPPPGMAVPYTPELADRVVAAINNSSEAPRLLRDCLAAG
jgi:tRNA modification GTPase